MEKKTKDYWSSGEQIYFVDGWAWGLDEKSRTVCLGREYDFNQYLETDEIPEYLPPIGRKIWKEVKENECGTGSVERSGDDKVVGRNKRTNRQTAKGGRITLRQAK